ncbi:hypothetical protein ACUH9Z_18240 [Vibrio cholerae]|uniref:hypothetical protein n=1 Tax=Vibrio cholerae TaxID=666 RepID=UPI00403D56E2
MKRLIQNPNLTLFYGESFLSNPVIKEHAPLCKEYLIAIKDVLDISLSEYNRVYVQRIDLDTLAIIQGIIVAIFLGFFLR